MATAVAYDAWEDPGLAFSEEEVAAFNPQELGAARRDHLLSLWAVAVRRADLVGAEKPQWWKDAAKKLLDTASWYCVAMEVPAFDRELLKDELPAPSTAEGKRLAKQALDASPDDFLGAWLDNAEACMRHAVTLGRRHAGKHKNKNSKRLANKLANCLTREMAANTRLRTLLDSRVS